MTNKKLIILDRDGVINYDSPDFIKSPEEWVPLPGSLEAIALLNQLGFTVVVVTNQSGVGRGLFSDATLKAMHAKMLDAVKNVGGTIDRIYYCPHTPDVNCACRKPKTQMFVQVMHDYHVAAQDVINVGDSLRDIQAGTQMGCKNFLVLTGKGEQTYASHPELTATICKDLLTLVKTKLQQNQ
jgi:D-glycero-D-manno-heptose 1,7-bisphosphate phosphatase